MCHFSSPPPLPFIHWIRITTLKKQQKYLDKYVNNAFDLTGNFIVVSEFYKNDILYFDVRTVM